MKLYLQKDLNDPSKKKLEYRSHPDENTIGPAPEGEEAEWLEVVEVEDLMGGLSIVVQVNDELKAQVLAERQAKIDSEAWLKGRMAEYPSMQDVMEALIENAEGRPEKLVEISAARAVVKANHPKPE